MPGSGTARQAIATSAATAARTATARDRRATTIAAATSSPPESTVSVETCAYGSAATARAHTTKYAASHPSSQLSSAATSGTNGWSAADRRPMPNSGATTGAAIAFAITEYAGTEPN